MSFDEIVRVSGLEEHGLDGSDVEALMNVMPEYAVVKDVGEIGEEKSSHYSGHEMLDEGEVPGQRLREGESRLRIGYSDFEAHLADMAREVEFDVSDEERLDLPDGNREEALGALFGASYAFFRHRVAKDGIPVSHTSFSQELENQDDIERFLQEGSYDIRGEIAGGWGYDHQLMNEIIDVDTALEAYNDVAEEII